MKSIGPNKRSFMEDYVFLSRKIHKIKHFPICINCNKWTKKTSPIDIYLRDVCLFYRSNDNISDRPVKKISLRYQGSPVGHRNR